MAFYSIRRMDAALLKTPDYRDADVRASFGHNPNSHIFNVGRACVMPDRHSTDTLFSPHMSPRIRMWI